MNFLHYSVRCVPLLLYILRQLTNLLLLPGTFEVIFFYNISYIWADTVI